VNPPINSVVTFTPVRNTERTALQRFPNTRWVVNDVAIFLGTTFAGQVCAHLIPHAPDPLPDHARWIPISRIQVVQ